MLSVGKIQAGTKNNIIPDKAVMRGTLRTFDFDVREQMLGRLQSFVADMARAYRAEARLLLPGRHRAGARPTGTTPHAGV